MSQGQETLTAGDEKTPQKQRSVQILLTSKELIKMLKKAQDKHGVFTIAGIDSKELLNGVLKPCDLVLVKMREGGNKLNHALLVDRSTALLIAGDKAALQADKEAQVLSEVAEEAPAAELQSDEMQVGEQPTPPSESQENVSKFPEKGSEANPIGY